MSLLTAFLVTFVAGPAAFWVVARREPSRGNFLSLWIAAVALVFLALGLQAWVLPGMPDALPVGLAIMTALWLAWIVVLATAVLAVRKRDIAPLYKRYAFALGAVATTLPWFGLYAAQVMTSR
jgi:hypothetical protein